MSYSDIPLDYKNTFGLYVYLFKCIGLDFFDESKRFFKMNNLKFLLFCICFYPFTLGQFALISNIRADNFLESVRVVPVDIMLLQNIVKMVIAQVRRSGIRDMILEVGELWPRGMQADDPKAVALKTWLRRYNVPFNLYFIFAMANLGMFLIVPILLYVINLINGINVYLLPFHHTNYWNVDSLPIYLLTYLWHMAGTILCAVCLYAPFDVIVMVMTSNVSILFRLLQMDLKNAVRLQGNNQQLKNKYVSDPESFVEMKRIVEVHQRLVRIADQLSSIFGLALFIYFVFASFEICLFGFLSMVYGSLADTIANSLTALNAILTIFFLALSGQLLCDTSSDIADAAYQSYWYESDVRVKNLILTIIIRAQRPSYLSALGFTQLTLMSFSKIMSSAWTYFSLLIQVFEKA